MTAVVTTVAVATASGVALGLGLGTYLVVLVGLVIGLLAGLADWRRSVHWLLAYLPFAGVASVLLYPRTAPALLVKDLLFIIPAYVGFLVRRTEAERGGPFGGAAIWLMASFALLVVGQSFNPNLPSPLVAAIGAKVWLFYIPLALLGYHLVTNRDELNGVLSLMSMAAVVPALIGIGEALLIYSGNASTVYGAYGDAAASVTQNFAEFNLAGGAILRRVPSTFAFVAQYFAFTVAMTAVAYARWRGTRSGHWSALWGAIWLLLLLAGFLSGARAAFLFLPFLMVLILVLEGRTARFAVVRLAAPAVLLLILTVAILGTTAAGILGHAVEVGAGEFGDVFVNGFRQGLAETAMGLGTGVDTNAARHAFDQSNQFAWVDGTWYESWYVKALLELGVAGLGLLLLLLGVLVTRTVKSHLRLRDPGIRAISASLLGLLIWNLVFNMKAQYLDIDPMNIYFWLLLGLLLKLPMLDVPEPITKQLEGGRSRCTESLVKDEA